jgi:hypothetical protein
LLIAMLDSLLRLVRPRAAAVLTLGALTACGGGGSLLTRVEAAMDGCLAFRRPAFQQGAQIAAISTPFPPELSALADKVAYLAAAQQYQQIAEVAPDQVTLVCSLELMSRDGSDETTKFMRRYLRHPNAEIVEWATALLRPRAGGLPRIAP